MLDKKVLIAFLVALIAIIVIGFVALNFVPTDDLIDLNVTDIENATENTTLNISEGLEDSNLNATNDTIVNDTGADDKVKNASSDIDPGDVLQKQTFTVSENETGQNEGMEPGTYVMYYTANDGPIKIQKIA